MKDIFSDIMAPAGAEVSIIPVMQGDAMPNIDQNQLPDSLPILALRNAVLFPGTVFPITIGREKSIRLIEDAERTNSFIGAVPQNDLSVEDPRKDDLYNYGTVAKIVKTLEMPDGTITAILQGYKRFEVETVFEYNPYLLGRVRYMDDVVPEEDAKVRMIAESLKEKAAAIIKSSTFVPREAAAALKGIDNYMLDCKLERTESFLRQKFEYDDEKYESEVAASKVAQTILIRDDLLNLYKTDGKMFLSYIGLCPTEMLRYLPDGALQVAIHYFEGTGNTARKEAAVAALDEEVWS